MLASIYSAVVIAFLTIPTFPTSTELPKQAFGHLLLVPGTTQVFYSQCEEADATLRYSSI